MTHYEILGVNPDATHTEIKSSYRRLVKQYHPDLNPSEAAKELIRKITMAYEILSDPAKKQSYDWQLIGYATVAEPEPPQPSEREIRRREYIKWKRAKDQQHWEQIFRLKVRFYKVQRYFAYLFLAVGIIYSYDYFFTDVHGEYPIVKIGLNKSGTCGVNLGNIGFKTDRQFFFDVRDNHIQSVKLHYSRLLDAPVGLSIEGLGYYKIERTLHTFNNFFSYLLLILAFVLASNRKYSDWALTLGLLPFFITAFLLLLTYIALAGLTL
ncbi:MAG: J domain-containing protein [Cyclobacteriaceae bacterium]